MSETPENEIPKQYNPAAAQEKWSAYWDEKGLFTPKSGGLTPPGSPFCIVIPPPNVTGALHLGHALNNTLQDIVIRMKRMQGFDTLWIPGVDHAGIATQAVVERKLFEEEKLTRHDIGREALVKRIWDWKEKYQERIIEQLKAMGCSCDWSRTRFTLDEVCAKAVRHFFFKLFKEGKIYRGKRLVNWDTHLQTAVSDDEVFHETVAGNFWYIKYKICIEEWAECQENYAQKLEECEGEKLSAKGRELIAEYRKEITDFKQQNNLDPGYVVVATTRPETMLGDTAVAVHPDPEAALDKAIENCKQKLANASEKEITEIQAELDAIEQRKTDGTLDWLKIFAELAKTGWHVTLPLLNKKIPLVLDEWAKPEKGTGCVKITPAHDPNDYEVGLRHDLPFVNILNKDGTLNDNAGTYEGLTVKQARAKVVADLEAAGLLVKVEEREIELAHSDRSKTPIEPFLNDQWFVKMDELAQAAIDAVARHPRASGELEEQVDCLGSRLRGNDDIIQIIPHRYTKGYVDWLSEKRDWPIGRQLWWGHRIPIWYCEASGEKRVESDEFLRKAFAGRDDVIWQLDTEKNVWRICSQTEDLNEDAIPGCKIKQEEDVLDTWFSSALWPHSTLGWPDDTPELQRYYPTGVLITNRDILTLWVARMVLAGKFNTGKKPFNEVYIHPKILDKYGEGMSKSKGNGIDPISIINKFGADALRFALAYLTTENQDIRLSLDFECPHCGAVVEQTKKNRTSVKIQCTQCKKYFLTQWARDYSEQLSPEDRSLPEGTMTGERFEVARNFCNKLWNAARFVLMNLEPFTKEKSKEAEALSPAKEFLEDKWILSRLATVTKNVTDDIENYRFADAMRQLYDFAWDDFCSFYIEISKNRLNDETTKERVQFVLVHVLTSLIRLLHPVMPFVTEDIYQRLLETKFWQQNGYDTNVPSLAIARFPESHEELISPIIEKQFAIFQELLRAVRDVRASRNVPPKTEITFSVRCDEATAELLEPMKQYFLSMAKAKATAFGPAVQSPALVSVVPLTGMDVFVDLSDLIDVKAETAKLEKEIAKLDGFISSKEAKLNSDFVNKAPAQVVEGERKSLAELQTQRQSAAEALAKLKEVKP
ncbi:MAG: valine--tRNA ligase [Planctomycetaceae bacterium]|nr:valine--tRNA ligase [Planctomycetaceae bacterium]